MADHMLTTVDNPFNPFTEFEAWLAWDEAAEYFTLNLLGRIAITSDDLSEGDLAAAEEAAIDEVATENVSGMHIKVTADMIPRVRTAS